MGRLARVEVRKSLDEGQEECHSYAPFVAMWQMVEMATTAPEAAMEQ